MKTTKKIYDSVHRFIHLNAIERKLINTRPFQRLHYIHQLGVTFFVYPGAVHRRFEHSLGAMELATRMYEEVFSRGVHRSIADRLPAVHSPEYAYWRAILRFSALCHDLGHLPFSHVAEKRLLQDQEHEKWTAKIIQSAYLAPIWEAFQKTLQGSFAGRDISLDVVKIALGPKKFVALYPDYAPLSSWEKLVSEMLTGDFFGADRIDYLLRDSQCSGLPYGAFDYHQLFEMLHVLLSDHALYLGIEENGIESCEALLLSRHYMHRRLYQYPTVKAYSFHLARFMESAFYDIEESLERYLGVTDNEVLAELQRASLDIGHPGHFDAACLALRLERFHAFSLKRAVGEEELIALREKYRLPVDQIAWELCAKPFQQEELSCPVLCADGSICPANELSEVSIPTLPRGWIFVAPQHIDTISAALAQAGHTAKR